MKSKCEQVNTKERLLTIHIFFLPAQILTSSSHKLRNCK